MADTGRIAPPIPTWPTRPGEGVVRRDRPLPDKPPKRDPRGRRRKPDEDEPPHIDEYA